MYNLRRKMLWESTGMMESGVMRTLEETREDNYNCSGIDGG